MRDAIRTRVCQDNGRQPEGIFMRGCRRLAPASCLVLLVASRGLAGDQPKKESPAAPQVSKDVRIACDEANAVASKVPGVSIVRSTGTFRDEMLREPVFGCGLAIAGSFARAGQTGDAATRLRRSFSARDWKPMPAYDADGTDGTSFAFQKGAVACLFRGAWDGGADGEPPIPALDWYKVAVFCTTPAFPENR